MPAPPFPPCCSPGSDIRPSVCLSVCSRPAAKGSPWGAQGAKPGIAPSPGRTSEEHFCTPSTQIQPGEDPLSPRGAQGAGFTPWALPPWDHGAFTQGFGDAKPQQAAAEGGTPNGGLHGDPGTLLRQLGAGRRGEERSSSAPQPSLSQGSIPPKCSHPPGWGFCVLQL